MKVVLFTEGFSKLGFGHITRTLSLAQALLEKGAKVKFILAGDKVAKEFLENQGFEAEVYPSLEEAKIPKGDAAFVDSYLAGLKFYEKVAENFEKKLYLDDFFRLDYPEGTILNYIPALEVPQRYRNRELLWGVQYHLLRKPFWNVPEKEISPKVENVLITFGGDDLRNLTPKVSKILLENFKGLKLHTVIGGGFKSVSQIEELKKLYPERVELYRNLNAEGMKKLMLLCDLAVSAGGQTLFELARVGTPTIAFEVANNQKNNIKGFKKLGFIKDSFLWNEKWEEKLSEAIEKLLPKEVRKEINNTGRSSVDGKGAKRVAEYLLG